MAEWPSRCLCTLSSVPPIPFLLQEGGGHADLVARIQMLVLFFCLVAKWARRTESAFYFTGASIREFRVHKESSPLARAHADHP